MHNRTALVAVVLTALNLIACSEADTSDAAQQESSIVGDNRFVETEQPAPFAGAIVAPVTKDELEQIAATQPARSYADLAAATAEQKNGVTAQPPVVPTKLASPIHECRSTYFCAGHGDIVLHHEGSTCMLGSVVLGPDWTARWREEPGTWTGDATFIDVTFHGVTSHCERKD